MRATPIPDDEVEPHQKRIVMGPPPGVSIEQIAPIEMTAERDHLGDPIYRARFILEPGDLERLTAGEPVWVSMWGHVVPFDVNLR